MLQAAIQKLCSKMKILVSTGAGMFLDQKVEVNLELRVVPKSEDVKRYVRNRICADNAMQREI